MKLNEELETTIKKDSQELILASKYSIDKFIEIIEKLKIKYVSHKEIEYVVNHDPKLLYTCIYHDIKDKTNARLKLLQKYKIDTHVFMSKEELLNVSYKIDIYKSLDNQYPSPLSYYLHLMKFFGVSSYAVSLMEELPTAINILTKKRNINEEDEDLIEKDSSIVEILLNLLYIYKFKTDLIDSLTDSILSAIKLVISKGVKYQTVKAKLLLEYLDINIYDSKLRFPKVLKFLTNDFDTYKELSRKNDDYQTIKYRTKTMYTYLGNPDKLNFLQILLKSNQLTYNDIAEWNKYYEIKNDKTILYLTKSQKKNNYDNVLSIINSIEE